MNLFQTVAMRGIDNLRGELLKHDSSDPITWSQAYRTTGAAKSMSYGGKISCWVRGMSAGEELHNFYKLLQRNPIPSVREQRIVTGVDLGPGGGTTFTFSVSNEMQHGYLIRTDCLNPQVYTIREERGE